MFTDEELHAFYAGKQQGYEKVEYKNPHLEFLSGIGGAAEIAEDKLHHKFKSGYNWGKAQRDEEDSQ